MADVRIRRGSEAWMELAAAMADESVQEIELASSAMPEHIELRALARPAGLKLVTGVLSPPPF